MATHTQSTYHHTQNGPWCLLLYAMAFFMLALPQYDPQAPELVVYGIGLIMFAVAGSFHFLTVEDEGHCLVVRFGPLPLFATHIDYSDIASVGTGRTTILDGWGIHMCLRGGWVWNIWGRDCVVIRRHRGTIRIGTDDPENLAAFLAQRIGSR